MSGASSPGGASVDAEPVDFTPPDPGLQAERTSLSWARTWGVAGADVLLVARLVAESSPVWAVLVAALGVVPLAGLVLARRRHEERVALFRRGTEVCQLRAGRGLVVVTMVVVLAAVALAAEVAGALGE